MNPWTRSSIIAITATLLFACATPEGDRAPIKNAAPGGTPQASIEAKQLAAENEAPFVAELTFNKGQAALNAASRERLNKLVKEARAKGELDDIKVLTWADREYPSTGAQELSKAQRQLAEERGKNIEKYLKNIDAARELSVDKHSMAERPNAFQNWLSTSDARLKKSLETAGIPNTDTSVKSPSKASKAIVMITLDR